MDDFEIAQEKYKTSLQTFTKVAPIYYARMGDYFRDPTHTDTFMLQKLCEYIKPEGEVLDVGCGPGGASDVLVQYGFKATGIDLSDGMIEQAKRDVPHVPFFSMDMREMSFPSSSFEAVAALYSLYQLLTDQEIIDALKEISRVLKKDGILAIALKDVKTGEKDVQKDWIDPTSDVSLGKAYYNFVDREFIIPKLQLMGYYLLYESFWSESKYDKHGTHRFYILQKKI